MSLDLIAECLWCVMTGVLRGSWYYEVTVTEMPAESCVRMGWSLQTGESCRYVTFPLLLVQLFSQKVINESNKLSTTIIIIKLYFRLQPIDTNIQIQHGKICSSTELITNSIRLQTQSVTPEQNHKSRSPDISFV